MTKPIAIFLTIAALLLLLSACVPPVPDTVAEMPAPDQPAEPVPTATPAAGQMRQRMGGGPGSGMMTRHHAAVPEPYDKLTNPVAADDESLARGQEIYATNCASCHGDTGMGEGPAGQVLDPVAAPVAHTSQMMSDAYLFWRISEGGAEFASAMPAWNEALGEQARWDVINYIRALGAGAAPGMGRGPGPQAGMDEGEHRADMLAEAVAQQIITQADAGLFERVHAVLDEHYRASETGMEGMGMAGMQTMQRAFTDQAVRDGRISQDDADRFTEIHDLLLETGIMQ